MSDAVATSAEDLVSEIGSHMGALEARRRQWEPLWDEIAEFCIPARQFYAPKDATKSKKQKSNFNNRAALDVTIASAGFQGYTANRRSVWMKLQFEDLAIMKEYGVADWLEDCERVLYATFSRSGLYEAIAELVPDLHTIGTGTIYIEDVGQGRIAYQTRHPLAVWIAENSIGEIDTLNEEVLMTNRGIVARFGEKRTSPRQREAAKKDPYGTAVVYHLVLPMDKRYLRHAQKPVDDRMAFCSVWYDKIDRTILDVGGYWEFPFAAGRYKKNAGEEYGRSPSMDALGDILVGNQMTKSRIKLGNLVADPALLVDEGLEGQDTVVPGVHIYRSARDDTIEPVALGANYPITKDNEERQDRLIDDHFSIPIYLMLQQMERQMTAREVIERTGEKAAILGPTTGRYEREILQPIIRRTFNLLLRAGKLPPPPRALQDPAKASALKVEFLGLLAQLQQRYYQTNGLNSALGYIQAVGEMFPESMDWVDQDKLMVEGMEGAGAPASVVREKDDVMMLREQRRQAQAAQMQQAQQMAQTDALMANADKLGKRPEPGSPLEGMGRAMAEVQGAPA